jgi:hypothetical protein
MPGSTRPYDEMMNHLIRKRELEIEKYLNF